MFTTFIVQPLFNLLTLIYGLLPGHDLGVAIILFTILIRTLLWPLVKKQLHSAKAMRDLQPEIKRIKKETKGDRTKESAMLMELYKEREINPFGSIGIVLLQLPIFIGLYSGIRRIISDPHAVVNFSYPFIQHLGWIKHLAGHIGDFSHKFIGLVDLTRPAVGPKGLYIPGLILVALSALAQYYQSKQLLPQSDTKRSLRSILKDAGSGKSADQTEVNAAVGRSTQYFIPVMIFVVTINLASALSVYWLTNAIVAYFQQSRVLNSDEKEMETVADKPGIIEGEVIQPTHTTPKPKNKKKSAAKKRRRR